MSAPTLPAEVARLLRDAKDWNDWADRMNRKALEAGIVSRETVAANRQRSAEARADLLARFSTGNQAREPEPPDAA